MILIAGRPDDPPLAAAWSAVRELGLSGTFADLSGPGVSIDGSRIITADAEVDRSEITGLYLRGYTAADPLLAESLRSWAELTPPAVRVVNRRAASATNLSKPAQGLLISRAGFAVPPGLLTTDPAAARSFVLRHQKVIVKSTSAVRSIVRLVTEDEDFSAVEWCPTQFQAWVPGTEFRVHVVGGQTFTKRVLTEAIDYRYGSTTLVRDSLPDGVDLRCIRLVEQLGLELAGIDLRRTPEGRWYCLEANTSPVWSSFDDDGEIARALASHLSGV